MVVTISNDRTHSGNYAFKGVFNNDNGVSRTFTQTISLTPGVLYESSYWFFSENNVAYSGVQLSVMTGGSYYGPTVQTNSAAAGQWVQMTTRFTALTNVATVRIVVGANKGPAGNTILADDVTVRPVV